MLVDEMMQVEWVGRPSWNFQTPAGLKMRLSLFEVRLTDVPDKETVSVVAVPKDPTLVLVTSG